MNPYKVEFVINGIAYSAVVMSPEGSDAKIQFIIAQKWGLTVNDVQVIGWYRLTTEMLLL